MRKKFKIKKRVKKGGFGKKGQYRIVSEVFLFAVGVVVTIFILTSFQDLSEKAKYSATKDQMQQISNVVSSAIIKARESNTTVKIHIGKPAENYRILATNNYLIVSSVDNPKINVTRFLNMEEYNIKGNTISEYINVVSNDSEIEIRGV